MAVIVNKEICNGCGLCIKACPEANAIKRGGDKKVSINPMLCKMCLLCASVCAKKAIVSED
jgi:Pyruvate/2-oxoacid:ferredoxin oxidoreductase delta subunit